MTTDNQQPETAADALTSCPRCGGESDERDETGGKRMIEKTAEMKQVEARKVKSMIWEALSEMFKDYLSENIGDDILECYEDHWELDVVVADIDAAVKSWANELEGLKEFVEECVEPFTDDDLEGW